MGGYTIVLGPISAIMIVDYFLVRKGKIDTPSLYRPMGRYRYTGGVVSRPSSLRFFRLLNPPT